MRRVGFQEFLEFAREREHVIIDGKRMPLRVHPPEELEPKDFTLATTTVWSFPKRGEWATHKYNARFRGNWAPQVARNLILLYSKPGDVVLDPFMGSGTTIIECRLLKRKCIGVDINYETVMLAWSRLNFTVDGESPEDRVELYVGDARNLNEIEDSSIDLIATHPPYASIIRYSATRIPGDLSRVRSFNEFISEMRAVAREFMRVLKPGGHVAIMMGDTRRRKFLVPISYRVLESFLSEGFALREHIIKIQHNMQGTRKWIRRNNGFLLIAHEHIFVFKKLESEDEKKAYKHSMKWQ